MTIIKRISAITATVALCAVLCAPAFAASDITVELRYRPKRKGLLRYRTYEVDFKAEYLVQNPAPIAQTLFFEFELPDADLRYDGFKLLLGDKPSARMPEDGRITDNYVMVDFPHVMAQLGVDCFNGEGWEAFDNGTKSPPTP